MKKLILTIVSSLLIITVALSAKGVQEENVSSNYSDDIPNIIVCSRGFSLVADVIYTFPEAALSLSAMGNTNQKGGSFQEYLDPNYLEKAVFGMDAGAEEIASYHPDYVILKSYLKGTLGQQIENLGIQVLYVDLETPEQYKNDLTAIGDILNNTGRAKELIGYFNEKREYIQNAVSNIPENQKPPVLFIYYTTKGGSVTFKTPPKSWLQSMLFEWAGSTPIWTDIISGNGWTEIGFEQIAAWNPDYIFVTAYQNDVDEVKTILAEDKNWQSLAAVKNNKLFAFPGDYLSWDQPDPRWVLGLYWITSVLHPEIISETAMETEIFNFFSFLYNIPEYKVKQDIIPRIKGDLVN